MPDEDQLYLNPRDPPRYDERHPAGSDLEFVMEQLARMRRDLWRVVLFGMLGGAGLVQCLALIFR
jgi:hypothetical protein